MPIASPIRIVYYSIKTSIFCQPRGGGKLIIIRSKLELLLFICRTPPIPLLTPIIFLLRNKLFSPLSPKEQPLRSLRPLREDITLPKKPSPITTSAPPRLCARIKKSPFSPKEQPLHSLRPLREDYNPPQETFPNNHLCASASLREN